MLPGLYLPPIAAMFVLATDAIAGDLRGPVRGFGQLVLLGNSEG